MSKKRLLVIINQENLRLKYLTQKKKKCQGSHTILKECNHIWLVTYLCPHGKCPSLLLVL